MNQRVAWIDYAKAICIFAVVVVHTAISPDIKGYLKAFLIPAFFFLSGIFTYSPERAVDFFKKKIKTILVPYLFFNIVAYLFWFFLGRHFGLDSDNDVEIWKPLLGILYGKGELLTHYVPMWFLPCLFVTETLFFFAFRTLKTVCQKLLMTIVFLAAGYAINNFVQTGLPWGIGTSLSLMCFYVAGHLLRKYLLHNIVSRNEAIHTLGLAIVATALFFVFCSLNNLSEIFVYKNKYGNFFFYMFGAASGVLALVAFMKLLSFWQKQMKLLLYIGQNSLIILGFHLFAASFIKAVTNLLLGLPLSIFDGVTMSLVLSLMSIVVLLPVIWIMNSNRILLFFIGRKK